MQSSQARKEMSPTLVASQRTSTQRMAEPMHRIVPRGASTGQSIRSYPKSCIDQVKDVCLYYVKKCSGRYEDNVTAARYIHQLAEEVITLLAGVAGEIKRNKSEPEVFQALLDEWNENFPPSLGAMGSPKAIATIIANQSSELNDLRAALDKERNRRDKDVSEILRSMDAQLQAYRNSVMSERRHQAALEQQKTDEYERTIAELKSANRDNEDCAKQQHHNELQQLKSGYEDQLLSANKTIEKLKQRLHDNVNLCNSQLERMRTSKDRKFEKLLTKYKVAQDKYYQLACTVQDDPSVLSSASFDETTTLLSKVEFDDFDDDDEEENEPNPGGADQARGEEERKTSRDQLRGSEAHGDGGSVGNSPTSRQRGLTRKNSSSSVKFSTSPPSSSTAPSAAPGAAQPAKPYTVKYDVKLAADIRIKFLNEQVELLKGEGVRSAATIEALMQEVERLHREIEVYLVRLKEQETMSEAYRQSLSLKMGVHQHIQATDCRKEAKTVLCHTPHFLGRADKKGCMSNHPVMSAYNTPGIF